LKKWLIQQESVPEDIIVHLEVSEVKRYFIPIYEFQVTYTMHWEGAFGYDTHSIAWEGSHTTTWEKKRGDHPDETVII
ncbi:hypothetical protein IAG15_27285, partial [Enterococcus faecalis]|nr:hypothetical protein [Enterococcus faecalis]